MKIVQISPYYPPHLGGMENVAREISDRLARRGYEVEVFSSDIGCKNTKSFKKNPKVKYLKAYEFAHTPLIPLLPFKLLKLQKDSLIHIHTAQAFTPEISGLISKIKGIKYIAHLHIDAAPSSIWGKIFLSMYKQILLKPFLKNAHKVIVLNKGYKDLVKSKYNIEEEKIKIIPNGVGEKFFTVRKKKNRVFHILFVGRLSSQKNPKRLINAIEACKSEIILDIVGEGELEEDIKKLVEEKKLKNIRFHGKKLNKELTEVYNKSDAFIITSNEEAFPLSILEASASGLPIIASDVKGNHEIVKNIGILVNPPTPNNFAKRIDYLVKNRKLQENLSKKSLKFANMNRWENIIPKWENLYKEVLNENKQK